MQFSKAYRTSLLTYLKNVFERSDDIATQTTYFFTGAAPTLAQLTSVLDAEWTNPTGSPLAPTDELSSYNGQLVGYCPDFLKSMSWSNHDQTITLTSDLNDDIDGVTSNYTAPVALFGEPQQATVVQGFDHTTLGDQTVTWALTLWSGTADSSRAIYVMHTIGTIFDSNAEIVVHDATLTTADPELPVLNVYSPVL
tara:strand:+ start:203414 stop:204001 length:588 start_codon:yes stop_codon:yes gene_type:complete